VLKELVAGVCMDVLDPHDIDVHGGGKFAKINRSPFSPDDRVLSLQDFPFYDGTIFGRVGTSVFLRNCSLETPSYRKIQVRIPYDDEQRKTYKHCAEIYDTETRKVLATIDRKTLIEHTWKPLVEAVIARKWWKRKGALAPWDMDVNESVANMSADLLRLELTTLDIKHNLRFAVFTSCWNNRHENFNIQLPDRVKNGNSIRRRRLQAVRADKVTPTEKRLGRPFVVTHQDGHVVLHLVKRTADDNAWELVDGKQPLFRWSPQCTRYLRAFYAAAARTKEMEPNDELAEFLWALLKSAKAS
jgi:hypothetical protein